MWFDERLENASRAKLRSVERLGWCSFSDHSVTDECEIVVPEAPAVPRIPEHRLILAVIEQAITDATPPEESWCPKIHRARGRHAEYAMEWFGSLDEDPWSFRWCLQNLGIDADAAQQRVLRKLA